MEDLKSERKPISKTAKIAWWLVMIGNGLAFILFLFMFRVDKGLIQNFVTGLILAGFFSGFSGFLLAIVASGQTTVSHRTIRQVALCFSAIVVECLVLAFVIFMMLLRINPRDRQQEAWQNLGSIYTAYQAYQSDNQTYPASPVIQTPNGSWDCLRVADWVPKGNTRYAYECMETEAFTPTMYGAYVPESCPVTTGATKDSFTVAACGNIDRDEVLDVWTMNDAKALVNVIDDHRFETWAQVYAPKKILKKSFWQRIRDWF